MGNQQREDKRWTDNSLLVYKWKSKWRYPRWYHYIQSEARGFRKQTILFFHSLQNCNKNKVCTRNGLKHHLLGLIQLQHTRITVAFACWNFFLFLGLKQKLPKGKCDSYTRMFTNESSLRVLPRRKNLWTFSLFLTFCFPRFDCDDFFVFFVLRQLSVLQGFTLRMSHILFVVYESFVVGASKTCSRPVKQNHCRCSRSKLERGPLSIYYFPSSWSHSHFD